MKLDNEHINRLGVIVALLLFPFFVLPVKAVGVGVEPVSLEIKVGATGTPRTTLKITNPSVEPGIFIVSADDLAPWFTFEPKEARLEAGEARVVTVIVHPRRSGRFATNLSVVGYPLDTRSFNAGSGLKVPVQLVVTGVSPWPWWRYVGLGLLMVAVGGGLALGYWQFRQRSLWQRWLDRWKGY